MRRKLQIGSVILLLIAAAVTMAFVVREYRRGRDASNLLYTRAVKKRDIVDAARKALAALNDAELREQNYVLTGETVYAEAYADDVRNWQDESATLELVAEKDPATSLAKDFSKAGTRTMAELAEVVSIYEKSGRDAALDRIRKSTGIVYLDQARSSFAMIAEADGGGSDGTRQINTSAVAYLRRVAEGAAMLFFLGVAAMLLPVRSTNKL